MATAQSAPPPPVPLQPSETFVNPKPGIVAPSSTNGAHGVSGARGFGDASFGYFLTWVTVYATTWLNSWVAQPHNICAQVITVDIRGAPQDGTGYSCTHVSPGGSHSSQYTVSASCGQYIGTRTAHQISHTNYNWGPVEDFDAMVFCS